MLVLYFHKRFDKERVHSHCMAFDHGNKWKEKIVPTFEIHTKEIQNRKKNIFIFICETKKTIINYILKLTHALLISAHFFKIC